MKPSPALGKTLKKASPTILSCIGAVGVIATAVLAVKATPKAHNLILADSRSRHDGDPYSAHHGQDRHGGQSDQQTSRRGGISHEPH